MVGDTEELEAPVWKTVAGCNVELAKGVHVDKLVTVDILNGIAQAVAEEGDANRRSMRGLVLVQQGTTSAKPAAVESTGNREDLVLFILGVVYDPALIDGLVVLGCPAHSHVVSLAGVGQCGATLLSDEVPSLGQIADHLLVAVLEPEGVGGVLLLAVRHRRARVAELGLAVG